MMSREEREQQHEEKISNIAVQVDRLVKMWPFLTIIGFLLGGAFSLGVFLIKYDGTLTKKPEFDAHLKVENANASTTSRALIIDSTVNRAQDQRLDKLETAKSTRVTATRYGKDVEFHRVN